MDDQESPPGDANRISLMAVFASLIGDSPVSAPGFNPWRHAALEMLEDALVHQGRSLPDARAQELQKARSDTYDLASAPDSQLFGTHHPYMQLAAAKECLKLRVQVEAGQGLAVMLALKQCIAHGLIVPGWLAAAFIAKTDAVEGGRARSWDDPLAFGTPYKSGKNISRVHTLRTVAPQAYLDGLQLLTDAPDTPLDKANFYEPLAEKHSMGATQMENALREYCKNSGGAFPWFADIKKRAREGMPIPEALLQLKEDDRFEQWCKNGGNLDQWIATFGKPPASHLKS